MTVSVSTLLAGPFTPNGVTTTFPFNFPVFSSGEVAVYRRVDGVDVPIADGFTVTGVGSGSGSIVFSVAPATDSGELYVAGEPVFTQSVAFENQGPFLPKVLNEVHDRGALRTLALKEKADRSVKGPLGETLAPLPPSEDRAGRFLAFDEAGEPMAAAGAVGVPATAFAASLLAKPTALATRQALGAVSADDLDEAVTDEASARVGGDATLQAGLDAQGAAITTGGIAVTKETLADLQADLAHGANTLGFVWNDPESENNGIYGKQGGSGSGSWLQSEIAIPAALARSAYLTVRHAFDADYVRPNVQNPVIWQGYVTPKNMVAGDFKMIFPRPTSPVEGLDIDVIWRQVYSARAVDAGDLLSGAVQILYDQSGNRIHASPLAPTRAPAYDNSDADLNNLASLTFDGSSDHVSVVEFMPLIVQPFTVVLVAKSTSLVAATQYIWDSNTSSGERCIIAMQHGGKRGYHGGVGWIDGDASDTDLHLVLTVFDGPSSYMEVDGVQVAAGTGGGEGQDSINLGAGASDSNHAAAKLGECWVFDGAVSVPDKAAIEAWVADRYGISF